ncbi:MAG: hypothetical protein ABEK59_05485 [Halobacteria archaeon]
MSEDDEGKEHVPRWDDSYFDSVAEKLAINYDLFKDHRIKDKLYPMFGVLKIDNYKRLLHPSLTYGHQRSIEYLFVERKSGLEQQELEKQVDFGKELAAENGWDGPDSLSVDHPDDADLFSREYTFVTVSSDVNHDVLNFVREFSDRNLIKFGLGGHYEINLVMVDLENQVSAGSKNTDLDAAFSNWDSRDNRKTIIDKVKEVVK